MDPNLEKAKYALYSTDIGLHLDKVTERCCLPLLKFRQATTDNTQQLVIYWPPGNGILGLDFLWMRN